MDRIYGLARSVRSLDLQFIKKIAASDTAEMANRPRDATRPRPTRPTARTTWGPFPSSGYRAER